MGDPKFPTFAAKPGQGRGCGWGREVGRHVERPLSRSLATKVGWGKGREAQKVGDVCIIMVNLHCCMAETNTTLLSNFTQLKKKNQWRLFTIARTWMQPRCPLADEKYIQWNITQPSKEWVWVSSSEVDESTAYYTEWSKSEREKQISSINVYIWNLEKWNWWTYLQGRNGDSNIENGLVNTVGERERDEWRK